MKTTSARPLVLRIVRAFIESEFFANWQSENVESGSYSRDEDRRDRYNRCYEAAENGADGSTHAEVIADMREAFEDYCRSRKQNRASDLWLVRAAADDYFDDLAAWHAAQGTLHQEIG